MRLPISKVYRAFPELDAFDDAACRRYVQLANEQFGTSKSGWIALGLIIAFAIALPGAAFLPVLCDRADQKLMWKVDPAYTLGGLYMAVVLLMAFTPLLLLRDAWLKRAILEKLRLARCPRCSYSLLGLAVKDGAVTCPECATPFVLSERGMRPEDLIARDA